MTALPMRAEVVYRPYSAVFWVWIGAMVLGTWQLLSGSGAAYAETRQTHIALAPVWIAFMALLVWLITRFDPFRAAVRYPQMLLAGAALGGTVALAMAASANTTLEQVWASVLDPVTLSRWAPALTAPFVEEAAKLSCAAVILVLCAAVCTRISHALLVGMFVGFGFDVMEDLTYATTGALASLDSDLSGAGQQMFGRIVTSVPSHWAFTGLTTVGLLLLLPTFSNPSGWSRMRRIGTAILLLAAGPLMHFVWNAPAPESVLAKMAFNLILFLTVAILLLREERRWVESHSDKAVRAGFAPELVASLPTWRGRRRVPGKRREVRRRQRAALAAIQA
ncbi:PrsW family glutamic-type intramembrane protease [Mycobacterium sp. ITM-2016-00317]|uniref:PrsW family glutamic-type intramembrane protease n=1 Tax=Mycobacterium sp. ITM-2016-00317 TaxID=2099694 RepID=UPI00287F6603|nr:PrsW family glutamic-type intramembrane protease [Mycobacterium sp. ITM-2016-00317]WNG87167.1 PrsW family glutamic-type intramembrane protease [Mycobacterium sp. ITM-2016-00317]